MSTEEEVVPAHPQGEVQIAGNRPAETTTSVDTFAGKIHVKWVPDAAVRKKILVDNPARLYGF